MAHKHDFIWNILYQLYIGRNRSCPPEDSVIVLLKFIPSLPDFATLSTKYFILSKFYTDEGGIK